MVCKAQCNYISELIVQAAQYTLYFQDAHIPKLVVRTTSELIALIQLTSIISSQISAVLFNY